MPPAKIFVAAFVDEFEILTVTYRRAIDREVLDPNFVCGFLVVPGEFNYALPYGRATAPLVVSKFKQPTLDLNHAAHALNRWRR